MILLIFFKNKSFFKYIVIIFKIIKKFKVNFYYIILLFNLIINLKVKNNKKIF